MYNIFVPSKNRVKGSTTIKLLLNSNLNFHVVVEPQDHKEYLKAYPKAKFLTLPLNNQGISYVRNSILNYARENNIMWYWQLDDDITGFFEVVNKRCKKVSIQEALSKAEEIVKELKDSKIAQFSLEYQQIAWAQQKDYVYNGYCDVVNCVNSLLSEPLKYDSYFNGKEDREFTIRLLLNNKNTLRITKYAFACPKNGSNPGGLSEIFYDNREKELAISNKLITRYPHLCSLNVKKDGRPDVKINWARLKPLPKNQRKLI